MRIAFISQPEYFRFMYENELSGVADVYEFKLRMGMNSEQFAPLVEFQADYNIFFRGEFVPDEILERLSGCNIALSSEPFPRAVEGRYEYTVDSLNRYLDFRSIRHKPFDYVFHYDAASLPLLRKDGLNISGEFMFPVATSVYAERPLEQQWDMFFIGRSTSHREKYFGHLKHHYNFLHICHGVWGRELVDYINASRICLNVHAENEVSWEPRTQMMLSCGAFVISERITPNKVLRAGVDYIQVANPREMYEAVEYYLDHAEERMQIANNGVQRVHEMLDGRRAFQRLIQDVAAGKYERYKSGNGSQMIDTIQALRNKWRVVKQCVR